MVKLGKKIHQARKLKHITQDELASAIGVSDKSISGYESDRTNPPLNVLEKISQVTRQPLSYFLEEASDISILTKLKDVEAQLSEIKKLLKQPKK